MNITHALEYLKSIEWSYGNGQCPSCYGCVPGKNWFPRDDVGHKRDCKLARAINGLAEHVDYNLIPSPKAGEDKVLQRMWRAN